MGLYGNAALVLAVVLKMAYGQDRNIRLVNAAFEF